MTSSRRKSQHPRSRSTARSPRMTCASSSQTPPPPSKRRVVIGTATCCLATLAIACWRKRRRDCEVNLIQSKAQSSIIWSRSPARPTVQRRREASSTRRTKNLSVKNNAKGHSIRVTAKGCYSSRVISSSRCK